MCSYSCYYRNQMNVHLVRHQPKTTVYCDLCGKSYSRKSLIVRHMHEHRNGTLGKVTCEDCNKVFAGKNTYRIHYRGVHMEKTYVTCTICKKDKTKLEISRHMKDSHGIRNPVVICHVCGKEYLQSKLRNHLRSHSKTVHKCDVKGCKRIFSSMLLLKQHKNSVLHNAKLEISCPHENCDRTLANSAHLRRHLRDKHRKIFNECPVDGCTHQASRKDYMEKHLKVHKDLSRKEFARCVELLCEMKFIRKQ